VVLAHKNAHCCVCAAAVLAACATAARSLGCTSPPMTHRTVQQQHACVHLHTGLATISALANLAVLDPEIMLRLVRPFAVDVSLQDQLSTGRLCAAMDPVAQFPSCAAGRTGAIDTPVQCDYSTHSTKLSSDEQRLACSHNLMVSKESSNQIPSTAVWRQGVAAR
jgi:hypothetical protein